MSPYDPDSEFSVSSLLRLQNAGFNFAQTLLDRYKFKDHTTTKEDFHVDSEPEEPLDTVVSNWLDTVGRPPTWKLLLEILQELGLGEMSHKIEKYLSCGKLSFQCGGEITCK